MVFTAVDERRVEFSALSEYDAVVPVRIDYLRAVENILQVLRETKNVMVVVDTSPIERFWMEEIGNSVKPLTNRVAFTWTNKLSFDEVLERAATLPPHSAIFWELMIVDAAGSYTRGTRRWEGFTQSAKRLFFSMTNYFLDARSSAARFSRWWTAAGRRRPLEFA